MIIVEGPDGAGKTTLVREICDTFPEVRVGKRGTDNRDFLWKVTVPDTMKALSQYALSQGQVTIWDRLFYSEMIYAPLGMPPRDVMFNPSQQSHVMRLINGADFPVILCLPPWELVEENIHKEHQMPGVVEHAHDIYRAYKALIQRFPDRTALYDYSGERWSVPHDEIFGEIQDYIDDKRERNW